MVPWLNPLRTLLRWGPIFKNILKDPDIANIGEIMKITRVFPRSIYKYMK
jgi:hypothetical protein